MSDPQGSDRIQQGVPTASGTGDISRAESGGSSGDPDASGPRYDDRTQR